MHEGTQVRTSGMGRKLKFPEKMTAAFPPGTFEKIERVLGETEDRTDFVREAVERELKRRDRRPSAKEPPTT